MPSMAALGSIFLLLPVVELKGIGRDFLAPAEMGIGDGFPEQFSLIFHDVNLYTIHYQVIFFTGIMPTSEYCE